MRSIISAYQELGHETCSFLCPAQGVDFFFGNRAHALKFISFVQSVVPMKYRSDKQLVSHNEHAATYNYKYTFSVEIVPICRVSCSLESCNPLMCVLAA